MYIYGKRGKTRLLNRSMESGMEEENNEIKSAKSCFKINFMLHPADTEIFGIYIRRKIAKQGKPKRII